MAAKLRRLSRRPRRRSRDRQGASIVYIGIMMFVICGFVSMGVDIGWIRVARNQMQTAADSAALAGALSLPDSDTAAAKTEAINFAHEGSNDFAGSQVSMQTGDIDLGLY
jgi:Flp pilus assembly protein TadG